MHSIKRIVGVPLVLIALFVFCIVNSPTPVQAQEGSKGPVTVRGGGARFDGDIRTLRKLPPTEKGALSPSPRELGGPKRPERPFRDPLLQSKRPEAISPTPLLSFAGLNRTSFGSGWPPDTNGDVGPNHYIQVVNTAIAIYDKQGNQLFSNSLNGLWSGVTSGTPCDNMHRGDPVVLYDTLADRWFVDDFAFAKSGSTNVAPFFECFAISQTADPVNGGWFFYWIQSPGNQLNDYPKFGVWPDAYYFSENIGGCCGGSSHVRVWALPRPLLLTGVNSFTAVFFEVPNAYGSLLPSNMRGTAPPAGAPNVFAAIDYSDSNQVHLWNFHVDFVTTSNSTFGDGSQNPDNNVTVASYTLPSSNVPASGGNALDTLGDRLMMQLQYRNYGDHEALFMNHSVDTGSNVLGIRWYEIRSPRSSPVLHQQGTFDNAADGLSRWMGSIAPNKFGSVAAGYSVSSSAIFPDIRYAGRLVGDTLGTFGQGEATLQTGGGSQTGTVGTPPVTLARWGDYSAMTVDPVDDCTFWYTTEYYATSGQDWQTRVGAFQLPDCTVDLAVSKTDSPDPVLAGANIVYTINVTNFGPGQAYTAALNDTIPTGTTFVSMTGPNTWTCSTPSVGGTGNVSCTRPSMPLVTDIFYLTVKVNSNTANASTISNTATVSTASTDSDSSNNSSTQTTTVANSADLSVVKTASPDPAVLAGNDLTYSIKVKNNGPTDALNVSMSDGVAFPATFVSVTPPGGWSCPLTPAVGSTGVVSCTKPTMTAGESGTITLVVHVPSNVVNGVNLSNTATVAATTSDPDPDNNTSTKTTLVQAQADLQITKTASPDPIVIAGTDLTYEIKIKNNGPSDSQSITINDKMPVYAVFKSLNTEPTGWVCTKPPVGNPGTVTCTGISVPAGAELTWTLVTHILPSTPDNTILTNNGIVTLGTTDPNLANNDTGAINTTVHTDAEISITKSDSPDPVIAGTELKYTIVLHSDGPSDAQNVVLTDNLPAQTVFKSLIKPASWICTTPAVDANGTVTCNKSPMPFDETATFEITVLVLSNTPASPPLLSNTAQVAWTDHLGPDNASDNETTTVQTLASFTVTKTSLITGVAGAGTIEYTITITNDGPSDQLNVVMTDTLDPTITQVSATADGGGTCSGDPIVTCNWAVVANDQTVHVVILANLEPDALNLCNTATVSWTDSFGSKTADDEICEVVPTQAEASITMEAIRVGSGRIIEYTIVVHTDGPSVARNVRIPDKLAKSTKFVSATTTVGTCESQVKKSKVLCKLGDLWPGTTVTIVIRVKIVKSVPNIKNTVRIDQDTYDSNLLDNKATTVIPTAGGNLDEPEPIEPDSSSLLPGWERVLKL